VYLVMKVFGSQIAVMTTSLHKALTVYLSFVIFKDKKFTTWRVYAIILLATEMSVSIGSQTERTGKGDAESPLGEISDVELEGQGGQKRDVRGQGPSGGGTASAAKGALGPGAGSAGMRPAVAVRAQAPSRTLASSQSRGMAGRRSHSEQECDRHKHGRM